MCDYVFGRGPYQNNVPTQRPNINPSDHYFHADDFGLSFVSSLVCLLSHVS